MKATSSSSSGEAFCRRTLPAVRCAASWSRAQRVDGDRVGRDAANVAEELDRGVLGEHRADAVAEPGQVCARDRAVHGELRRALPIGLIDGAARESHRRPMSFDARGRSTAPMTMDNRTRWLALLVLCLGDLMIVLDTTIVNVALPSIREDLGFSEASLAWVVNAYLLTFGGFLLLGGRLGDLFGHRRLFLIGIALFTLASLACGLATSQEILVAARAVQGLGGAVVSAVALSLIMMLFTEPAERAKAMGVFGFVAAGGGSIGVLLGGVLTDVLNWHWIFLVNVPIGVAVFALSPAAAPGRSAAAAARSASTSPARSP